MRCIVIGAGIIGTTVAWRLAQRGSSVTLLDQGLPGGGTTGTTFAWVNARSKAPRPYFDLNADGMAAHARLAAEFGDAPWLVPTGNLEWDTSPEGYERLAARARRLMDWGYRVRHLTPHEVERLEPDLLLGSDVHEVLFYPDESFIFPPIYLRRGNKSDISTETPCLSSSLRWPINSTGSLCTVATRAIIQLSERTGSLPWMP